MSLTVEELVQALAREMADILRQNGKGEQANKLMAGKSSEAKVKQVIKLLPTLKTGKSTVAGETQAASMLATAMAVLERAYVDSIEGNQLMTIVKELILRMDQAVMSAEKASQQPVNRKEIDKQVSKFYTEVRLGSPYLTQMDLRAMKIEIFEANWRLRIK